MSRTWRIAAAATFALLALQWAWSWAVGIFPVPRWLVGLALSLPLLPPALLFMLRRPRAPLWSGIVALLYFCLGVASARVDGGAWAWLEIALSLVIVVAAGWPGIAAKMAKRRAAPPPNV